MSLLDFIPGAGLVKLAVCAVALSAAGAGVTWFIHHERDVGRAEIRAEWDTEKLQQQAQALAQSQTNARETIRRIDRQQEAQDAHDKEIARARADAAGAAVAAGRLRDQLATFAAAARGAAGNPGAVGNGTATGTPVDLLADLFSRADSEAGILAEALDRSYAAGVQCVRAYEALKPPVSSTTER